MLMIDEFGRINDNKLSQRMLNMFEPNLFLYKFNRDKIRLTKIWYLLLRSNKWKRLINKANRKLIERNKIKLERSKTWVVTRFSSSVLKQDIEVFNSII